MALDRPELPLSEAVFTWIYRHNAFGSAESVSGPRRAIAHPDDSADKLLALWPMKPLPR